MPRKATGTCGEQWTSRDDVGRSEMARLQEGDVLAGEKGEQTGKIKLYAWRGQEQIKNPDTDAARVGSWFGGRIRKSSLNS